MPRSLRSLAPRYAKDRLAWAWWQRRHPEMPWLVPGAVNFLDGWLSGRDVMVEFGSGRSTRWFSRRVERVVSIEHDPDWHAIVKDQLAAAGVSNVDYRLAPEEPGPYVAAADDALGGVQPAVILVDGRLRDHCARWALDRLAPGGILVIDNANWYLPSGSHSPASRSDADGPASSIWTDVLTKTARWRRVWFGNGVNDTVVLFSGTE